MRVTLWKILRPTKNINRTTLCGSEKVRKEETVVVDHFIIMSSAYTEGVRVALNFIVTGLSDIDTIQGAMQNIKDVCGHDVPLSTHMIETNSESWQSIVDYDPYFEGVVCVDSVKEFIKKVNKSRTLTGLDVAKYILSMVRCTHLSLEKLAYFAYADYLCAARERLFEDKIYAFTYGPVIESIYGAYKNSGYQYVDTQLDVLLIPGVGEMAARSRIVLARGGLDKLISINRTVEKYGALSARELVELTHREGSPWSQTDSTKKFQAIPDELTLERHHVECL